VEHAERAAIYQAARYGMKTHDATMYCPWFACSDCARAIVAAGIKRVVGLKIGDPGKWATSIGWGDQILTEAGVEVCRIEIPKVGVTVRHNGKDVER
jgi:dCMP deaminase